MLDEVTYPYRIDQMNSTIEGTLEFLVINIYEIN